MTVSLALVVVIAVLVGCGVTLVLERSLTRVLLGFVMIGNGINVMFLVASGDPGSPPLVGFSDEPTSDPLPQAMALTAIVITLGISAFVLALAYRSWQLFDHDDVQDDLEDDLVRRRAERDETSSTFDAGEDVGVPDEDGSDDEPKPRATDEGAGAR